MKLEEYIIKMETLKKEIIGCDNLIDFYKNKKYQLQDEYDRLMHLEIEVNNDRK